jgi:hypothetical protein
MGRSMKTSRSLVLASALAAFSAAMAPPGLPLAQPVVRNQAVLELWLDKNGGYKDKSGGYYNPKAGTYTDKEGGVVDNWGGYTYTDGSYKLNGNYYDAKKHTVFLAGPAKESAKTDAPAAEVIKVMRDDVAQNGGYDKNLTRKSMFEAILQEHSVSGPQKR